MSSARKLGCGVSAASRRKGEKIRDCGSAICGVPAKTLGDQKGDWPLCSAVARNWSCAWKWALAS